MVHVCLHKHISLEQQEEPQLESGDLLLVVSQLHLCFFSSLKKLNSISRYQPLYHPLPNLHQLTVVVSQVGNEYSIQQ